MKTDFYEKITKQIVAELEKAVRPWCKQWNAEHTAGRCGLMAYPTTESMS
jgi:antirestriction protein ArdC